MKSTLACFDFSYLPFKLMFKWVQSSCNLGELLRVYLNTAVLFVTLVAAKLDYFCWILLCLDLY